MDYIVIKAFQDSKDRKHLYQAGDPYPREGYTPDQKRIDFLCDENNPWNQPFIKLATDTIDPEEEVETEVDLEVEEDIEIEEKEKSKRNQKIKGA